MAFLDDSGVVDLVGYLKDKITASFATKSELEGKQNRLISGTTIKTINNSSLLGSGNIYVASSSHYHGSISDVGAITSDTTVASGDKLVIVDSSDYSKLKRSGIAFGSSASTFLRNDGTWAEPSSGGSITPSSTTPAMDGTAAVGTSTDYARADHVHPTDTSRAASSHTHSGYASSTHTHGSITNAGAITSDTAIGSGDKLVVTDSSDSAKLKRSPISFGTSTTLFLANNGTWKTPSGDSGSGLVMYRTKCTLPTSGWSNDSITVTAHDVTASNDIIVAPAPSSAADYIASGVSCVAQGAGTLTFTRTSANSSSIEVNVLIFNQTRHIVLVNVVVGVTADKSEAAYGETVTVSATSARDLQVMGGSGSPVYYTFSIAAGGTYTFSMPDDSNGVQIALQSGGGPT